MKHRVCSGKQLTHVPGEAIRKERQKTGYLKIGAKERVVLINKILLASDGSKTAWKAVTYAADLAKQTGAA